METIVHLGIKIKVPTKRVDEVTQRIVDLLAELDVYDGAKLEQSNATIELS